MYAKVKTLIVALFMLCLFSPAYAVPVNPTGPGPLPPPKKIATPSTNHTQTVQPNSAVNLKTDASKATPTAPAIDVQKSTPKYRHQK